MPVVKTGQFWPKAKRERQNLYAGPTGDEEVSEFMKEDNDRKDKQEGNDVADQAMA
jgi:hypothetical protein